MVDAMKGFEMMKVFTRFEGVRPGGRSMSMVAVFRHGIVLAVFFSLVYSNSALAQAGGEIGIGYFDGPTSGPTVSLMVSPGNALKIVAPTSFENIVLDYQYIYWDVLGKQFANRVRFGVYFGVGWDLSLMGNNKDDKGGKDEDKAGREKLSLIMRIPVGFSIRLVKFPVELFLELAPMLEIYNGSDFDVKASNLELGSVGVGLRYHF